MRRRSTAPAAPAAIAAKPKRTVKTAPQAGSRTGGGARRLESEIEAAEAALRTIEDELSDPAAWASPEASARSTERHEAAKQLVSELYERYEAVAG